MFNSRYYFAIGSDIYLLESRLFGRNELEVLAARTS